MVECKPARNNLHSVPLQKKHRVLNILHLVLTSVMTSTLSFSIPDALVWGWSALPARFLARYIPSFLPVFNIVFLCQTNYYGNIILGREN